MALEIAEQPEAIARLLAAYAPNAEGRVCFDPTLQAALATRPNLLWAACGSSLWAATLGAYALAELASVACAVRPAHELVALGRSVFRGVELTVLVSQSGQTQDTLEAMELAHAHACPTLAVVNAPDSAMATQSRWCIDTHAGPEHAVPSTKGFITQAASALLLAASYAEQTVPASGAPVRAALHQLPEILRAMQMGAGGSFESLVRAVVQAPQVIFVGRGPDYPIAAEGALKLMESAQMAAQGFAMGEFKHGPMACLNATTPVVALVTPGPLTARTRQNLNQLRTCGAPVWWIGPAHMPEMADFDGHHILVAKSHPLVAPLIAVHVLQSLAWHVAQARGLDPNRPQHLVKSITQL
jgi:glucosamine--fructose-6-phosphate aminotransferase (isomerizing)